MRITLVKKILADGSPCGKCRDVEQKLKENDQEKFLDETLIADERDPESAGMALAQKLNVQRAPFFVVEEEGKEPEVYTVYFKFAKEVLAKLAA
ncbi:hypothetical protein [Microbulbifer agarilyticus]|uniref:hypothetical protein n=1 Tax=Microbulbifer agarilyticus TaxID=260552 RepID=UPI001C93802C|nr:hypothetical protein [Microbulbifer agarilyticus]MBY6189398.1 hypothetical protein [Microbulbifer agarilyticus]MCA0891885.1 hypothetical protein [Microbulbifer agarilyticus]MCA0901058.1 hypothetical protein [Microbulbifer agarilyticus]